MLCRSMTMMCLMVLAISFVVAGPTAINMSETPPHCSAGPVSRTLIGLNLPVHPEPAVVARTGVTGRGTNGVWEALRELNPGYVRQWLSAPECGIHDMPLPTYDIENDGPWQVWIGKTLSPDSPYWATFDDYMALVAALGSDVDIMLCMSTFPVWIGPFRQSANGRLRDTRTGEIVPYQAFIEWAGIEENRIGDAEAFDEFAARVTAYTRALARHCQAQPLLRRHIRAVEIGNEPDNGGEIVQNDTRWRMFVYGREWRAHSEELGKLLPGDEGLLQRVYAAAWLGLRDGDPDKRIAIGGPGAAWSHNQKKSKGAYYYLEYFIDGRDGVPGIGRDRLDFISYHNYGSTYNHEAAARDLNATFDAPIYLTEYNSAAAAHGINFMQTGATTVANTLIQCATTPAMRGAAFFKASGGGFGMILNRPPVIWRTGAYFAMKQFSEWIVGGLPVAWPGKYSEDAEVNWLIVRRSAPWPGYAAVYVNLTDEPQKLNFNLPELADQNVEIVRIELPIAQSQHDYRNVRENEIIRDNPAPMPETINLAPRGVVFLRWQTD